MDEGKTKAIKEAQKIISAFCEVKMPGAINKLFGLFKTTRPHSDIPMLSHLIKNYFESARERHDCGDYSGAVKIYKEAAEAGSQLARLILTQYYLLGLGEERDVKFYLLLLEKVGDITDGCARVYSTFVNTGFYEKTSLDLGSKFTIYHFG